MAAGHSVEASSGAADSSTDPPVSDEVLQGVGVFELFRTWLREQFEDLGFEADAGDLAMHVLAFSQGVATLSNAFHDSDFVYREVERINTAD